MPAALWTPPVDLGGDASSFLVAALAQRLDGVAGRVALAFSLQLEDAVILHVARAQGRTVTPVVLDTGRLHPESLAYLDAIEARYGTVARVAPRPDEVDAFVAAHGIDGFYDSVEARKACCRARKVEPLARALAGYDAWVTGQRRQQALSRSDLPFTEHDAQHGIAKLNPIADWTTRDVWTVARALGVPPSPLYARGFASIGCEPCTRPIRAHEDERAGRWWWEGSTAKECGLHVAEEVRA